MTDKDPTVKTKINQKEAEAIDRVLKGILGWIDKRKAQTVKEKTSAGGWLVGLVVAVIVFVGLAVVAFWIWRKGREVAKLKHKIDVDKEKKIQAEVDAKLTVLENKRKRLEEESVKLQLEIKKSELKLSNLESERKKAHAKIDAILTWDDLDRSR